MIELYLGIGLCIAFLLIVATGVIIVLRGDTGCANLVVLTLATGLLLTGVPGLVYGWDAGGEEGASLAFLGFGNLVIGFLALMGVLGIMKGSSKNGMF